MGASIELYQNGPLILSVEIDREITIEISTGFQDGIGKSYVTAGIPVSVEKLEDIVQQLSGLVQELKQSWKCPDCNTLNNKIAPCCETCYLPKP